MTNDSIGIGTEGMGCEYNSFETGISMPQLTVALDENGLVTLTPGGFSRTPAGGLQSLEVLGGVLQFDIAHPDGGVRALVSDIDAASWWLPEIYGEAGAVEAIRQDGLEATAPRPTELIETDWGPLLATTVRMMTGLWIRRWWPAPVSERAAAGRPEVSIPFIEEWLIDIELASLASDAEQLFGGVRVAGELASPYLTTLAWALGAFLSSDVPVERWIGDLLTDSAVAALDAVPLGTPGYDELEAAVDNFRDPVPAPIPLPAMLKSDLALAAGTVASSGRSTVYWLDVHPRRVSASPGAVQWEVVEADGGYRVVASVSTSGASPGQVEDVFGRVESSSGTLGIAFAPDVHHEDKLVGSTYLDSTVDPASVRVTLFSGSVGSPSRSGPTDAEIARVRAEVFNGTQRFLDAGADLIRLGNFDGRTRVPAAALLAIYQASQQS